MNNSKDKFNDPNLDKEHILLYLAQGKREPQNQWEEKLLKEIEEAKRAGKTIDIPFID